MEQKEIKFDKMDKILMAAMAREYKKSTGKELFRKEGNKNDKDNNIHVAANDTTTN